MATTDNTTPTPTDEEVNQALRVLHEAYWRIDNIFRQTIEQDDIGIIQMIMAESGFLAAQAVGSALQVLDKKIALPRPSSNAEPRAFSRALYSAVGEDDLKELASESMRAQQY